VIRQLSTQANINIVAESNLSGTITAHLSDVPLDDAIRALFSSNNFILSQNAGIYYVASRSSRRGSSFAIFFSDGLLTIDVKNAPLTDVLQEIASQAKVNMVTVGNVQGNVTMRLEGVTLERALEMISASSGVTYKKIDDVYVIGDATVKPGQENPLIERKVIWLKHIDAEELVSALPSDIPRTSVTVSQDRNAIIVIGTRRTIEKLEKLVEELDVEDADIRSRMRSAIWVEVSPDGLISLDVKDAPIEMVVREISIKTGVDIVIVEATGERVTPRARRVPQRLSEERKQSLTRQTAIQQPARGIQVGLQGGTMGNINVRIENATLEEVFDALFAGTGYTYTRSKIGDKEIYIIGEGGLALGWNNPLTVSKRIPLKYLDVTKVMELLPPTIPQGNITVIPDQNAIVVVGTPEMIDELEKYLSQIDSPTPQVMIEAMLLELTGGNTRDLGIEWSGEEKRSVIELKDGFSLTFDTLEKVPEKFNLSLRALLAENKARILANPRVAVLSGGEARINVGVQYLFRTEIYGEPFITTPETTKEEEGEAKRTPYYYPGYPGGYMRRGFNVIDTGITLDITPWVGNAGEITMEIKPEIRDADRVTAEESRIADRSIQTTIRVKDGGMIVIGGLIQEKELKSENKMPVLGSIPILGRLFTSSHKVSNQSELVIVIMPKLIK